MQADDRDRRYRPRRQSPKRSTTTARSVAVALVVGLPSLLVGATPHIAAAAGQTVTNCNNSGTGSLREAVRDVTSGGSITFALLPSCGTIVLGSTIRITHNMTIDGPGPSGVEVSGDDAVDVFDVSPGVTATISGLTIAHGGGNYNGGGIYNNGTLTVADSVVTLNSSSGLGGAISNVGGILDLVGSNVFGNNAANLGGGIFNGAGSTATVNRSSVLYNDADSGGGILNEGTVTVVDSTLSGNGAVDGGGIDNDAILNVTGSTLSGNAASDAGGGILNGGYASLASTIVANNKLGHDCSGNITDAGYNLDDDGTCGFSPVDHSLSGVKPELGPLVDNGGPTDTESPAMGSPVLGQIPQGAMGNGNTLCSGTDQRGVPRPPDADCDIGAVEMECDIATVGVPVSFTVTTFGTPVPSITEKGSLPAGVTFTDNGNGTATIAGTPQNTGESIFIIKSIFGKGGTKRVVKQSFTLTVG